MDMIESVCVAALVMRHRKRKGTTKLWVHPLISSRLLNGQFYKLFTKLCQHETKFFNYFRMKKESFDELLALVGPSITYQNTTMRMAVSKSMTVEKLLGNGWQTKNYVHLDSKQKRLCHRSFSLVCQNEVAHECILWAERVCVF